MIIHVLYYRPLGRSVHVRMQLLGPFEPDSARSCDIATLEGLVL